MTNQYTPEIFKTIKDALIKDREIGVIVLNDINDELERKQGDIGIVVSAVHELIPSKEPTFEGKHPVEELRDYWGIIVHWNDGNLKAYGNRELEDFDIVYNRAKRIPQPELPFKTPLRKSSKNYL